MGKVGRILGGIALIGASITIGALVPGFPAWAVAIGQLGAQLALSGLRPTPSLTLDAQRRSAQVNASGTLNPLPIVYGQTRLGLRMVDVRQDGGVPDHLYVVGALCHGSADGSGIQSIGDIYFDDVLAVNAAGVVQAPFVGFVTVTKYLGSSAQAADATLQARFGSIYDSSSQGRGVAYLVLRLTYNPGVFPRGLPTITADVTGVRLFDPRSSTWVSSGANANPALVLRDYLTAPIYGLGAPTSEINDADVIVAANYCDEVIVVNGSNQTRYVAAGFLDSGTAIAQNIQSICSSFRGVLVYEGGQFRVTVRRPQAAALALTDADVIGNLEFALPGVRDRANRILATILDPAQNYQPREVVYPRNGAANAFLTADNNYEVVKNLELPLTPSALRAEQLAMIALRESRSAVAVSGTFAERAFALQVGDVVTLTHQTPGWVAKAFWVVGIMPVGETRTVSLLLAEYDATAYTLDAQTALPTAPANGLPSAATVVAPSGITLTSTSADALRLPDGSSVARVRATWTASTDPFLARYEVQAKPTAAASYGDVVPVERSVVTALVPAGADGSTDVRVRAVNTLGVVSAWVSGSLIGGVFTPANRDGNLLRNGDGQEGAVGAQAPGWSLGGGNGLLVASDYSASGDRSLKVTNGAAVVSSSQTATIAVTAGKFYRFSGVIRTASLTGGNGGFVSLVHNAVAGFSVAATPIGPFFNDGQTLSYNRNPAAGTGETRFDALVRMLLDGTVYARAGLDNSTGSVWFDELRLEEVSADEADRLTSTIGGPGIINQGGGQDDGAATRPLMKGYVSGTARHNTAITFPTAFNLPPTVRVAGGITYQPASVWGTRAAVDAGTASSAPAAAAQYEDAGAEALTAAGFTLKALLYQPGTLTARTLDFSAGHNLTAAGQSIAATLAFAPATGDSYRVRGQSDLNFTARSGLSQQATVVIVVESSADGGTTWVTRATINHVVSDDNTSGASPGTLSSLLIDETINAPGLSTAAPADQIRLRIASITRPSLTTLTTSVRGYGATGLPTGGITYTTSTGDQYASKTPAVTDSVRWEAFTNG